MLHFTARQRNVGLIKESLCVLCETNKKWQNSETGQHAISGDRIATRENRWNQGYVYRIIHKSLQDFRPLRYSSRDGHAEGEHVNRGRDTPSFCSTLQVLDMSTLGDAADVNPVIKFLPHTWNVCGRNFITGYIGIMYRWCCRPAASSVHYTTSCKHTLVVLRMGEIIARKMLSWLELLINRYCCI